MTLQFMTNPGYMRFNVLGTSAVRRSPFMIIDKSKIDQAEMERLQRGENTKDYVTVPIVVQDFIMQLLQLNANRTDYFKSCLSCEHFTEVTEVCALAGARPPAKVIVNACPSYKEKWDDDVPF
jgi:hypothetical protein